VIERRNTVPVLSNILLEAVDGVLKIAVTDLEVFFAANMPCQMVQEGSITVGVKQLYDIVRELSNEMITLRTQDNHWVELASGKANFQLMGLPARDFPSIPEVNSLTFHEVDSQTLLEMVDKTQFSVSNDETRYHLNGVYFTRADRSGQRSLRMVSTDGHRLSLIDRSLSGDLAALSKGVIIPKKGLAEIRKLLTEVQGPLFFAIDENRAVIKRGNVALQVRLIEGEFPDYQKVIPKGNDKKLRLSRDLFLASLKRISLLSNDTSKTVTFNIRPGFMEIRSNNPNVGEAKEDLEINYQGENLKIGFNARYFIDVLSSMNTSDVQLELKDQLSPGVIKSPADESYTAVVMPMRI
jgi:DNA polymerase-3 subunit beta